MITGYICLLLGVCLVLKFVSRRVGNKKWNLAMARLHKPMGAAVLFFIAIHLAVTYKVWETRAGLVVITGFLAAAAFAAMALSYIMRKKGSGGWLRLHRCITVVLLFSVAAHMTTYFLDFGSYRKSMENIEIQGMDAAGLPDGEYIGSCDAGYIFAQVKVTVQKEKITAIEIMSHKNERGKAAEKITEKIQEQQTTKVDAVSGATNSSNVIKKAVEHALQAQDSINAER